MGFRNIFYLPLIVAAAVLTVSCAAKKPAPDSSVTMAEAALLTYLNTPVLCGYKGRAAVSMEDENGSRSFGALMDKSCSGNIRISILGALNSLAAEITYENGVLKARAPDRGQEKALTDLAEKYIHYIINYLRSPYVLPGYSGSLGIDEGSYVFTEPDGVKIFAGSDFRIYKYSFPDKILEYVWDKDAIKAIKMKTTDWEITVKFLNLEGWKNPEAAN